MSFMDQFNEDDEVYIGGTTVTISGVETPEGAGGRISYECPIGTGCAICKGRDDQVHTLHESALRAKYRGHAE